MGHQPFEDWLLSDETLPPQQAQALREHLRDCEACRQIETSWAGVRLLIRFTPPAAPAAGFTARLQERLAEQERIRHRRQSLSMLLATGGAAAVLLAGILIQIVDLLRSPSQILAAAAYRLFSFWVYADTTGEVVRSILRLLPVSVPGPLWIPIVIFVPGIMTFLLVLWIVSYRKLTSARRIIV